MLYSIFHYFHLFFLQLLYLFLYKKPSNTIVGRGVLGNNLYSSLLVKFISPNSLK